MAKASKTAQKKMDYADAQASEAEARGSHYPDAIHEDVPSALEAKQKAVKAHDEHYRLVEEQRTSSDEKLVTLVGPNPNANITDSNGLEFKDGKAENVKESLAQHYVESLEGYSVQNSKKDNK